MDSVLLNDPALTESALHGLLRYVVAVMIACFVIEGALDVLFSWKTYQKHLSGKGFKVPIAIAVSIIVSMNVGQPLDFMAALWGSVATPTGSIITAFFMAGGSKKVSQRFGNLKRSLKEVAS